MALKSKFFRIATEGDTTDGRVIERSWLQQMADTYDRTKYAARVWMEHIRSYAPDGPFGAYGDVLALQARAVEDGKLALFAQIEPLPALIALNRAKQKLYTSMEVSPNFAKTGSAYLVGLAVTDTPASLGTEMLEFAAKNPAATPLAARKQDVENLFSASSEVCFEFEDEQEERPSLAERVKQLFSKAKDQSERSAADRDDFARALDVVVGHVSDLERRVDAVGDQERREKDLVQQLEALRTQFADLQKALSAQDANPSTTRAPATGGTGQVQTDC